MGSSTLATTSASGPTAWLLDLSHRPTFNEVALQLAEKLGANLDIAKDEPLELWWYQASKKPRMIADAEALMTAWGDANKPGRLKGGRVGHG